MTFRPLKDIKILEFAGIGPGPFAGMILADMGADVVRIDRPGITPQGVGAITGRGRRSVALDLKSEQGLENARKLIEKTDALFEGFRPGVMERIGLGPDDALAINPKLVYGRMTGFGQYGPLAERAGHDINFIALSGVLGSLGEEGTPPQPPLNLVGDYGGGAMFLVAGLLAGIIGAKTTGSGHVVDAAMTDGSALMMAMFHDLRSFGLWQDVRGGNFLDGAAPFYGTYECADGKYVSIGAIEPQFYALLIDAMGLADDPDFQVQMNQANWPAMKDRFSAVFKSKTQADWCDIMQDTDICFAPVLSMAEAAQHPHNKARQTFVDLDSGLQPAVAPRFRDVSVWPTRPAPKPGQHTEEVFEDWGIWPS